MPDSAEPLLRGSNKTSMRARNERLVITLLHRFGALSRAEIAARREALDAIEQALGTDAVLKPEGV